VIATSPETRPAPDEARDLDILLSSYFGFPKLRPFQRETLGALFAPRGRVLLVAPTGGGKSLCYQLPALVLPGTTLVVSPLVALMEDQVRSLEMRGIPATYLASTLSGEEIGRRLAALRRGRYKLVYAAPERLAQGGLLPALVQMGTPLVAIDEAHCIVQWGHDFRPDYLRIGEALDKLRPPRVIACTATATRAARAEIMRRLGWSTTEVATVLGKFSRPNLGLGVSYVKNLEESIEATSRALGEAVGAGAGIVYAATRKAAEEIGVALRSRGWDAPVYHGGTSAEERARISSAFAARQTRVLVATNAFGMGVDRPDVRIVVHAQPPASLEAYYQEVGRAGRDGCPARGLLLVSKADLMLRRRLARRGPEGGPAKAEDASRALARFQELVRYIEAKACRNAVLLRHFGETLETPRQTCGTCDLCERLTPPLLPAVPAPTLNVAENKAAPAPEKPRGAPPPPGVPGDVYEALCRFRAARALSLGVPAYIVAPNRALLEMAMLRPSSADELGQIHGLGPVRIAAHGEGFLRALRGVGP